MGPLVAREGRSRPNIGRPVKRNDTPAADRVGLFVAAADRQDNLFDHDMLHAAARLIEVTPRYAHSGEIEYVARWLDAAWERFVISETPGPAARPVPAAQSRP